MTQNFLDIDDLTTDQLHRVLDEAADMKAAQAAGTADEHLAGRTLAMLFEKPSTRTRVSFETGMTQLGGHAIFLGENDIQLGHGEPIKDTGRALGRYADAIMARVFDHSELETLAEYAEVPVINGLSDDAHPAQTLADLLTLKETVGFDSSVAWVGDGNNVAASFALGCAMMGIDLTVATPEEYGLSDDVLSRADDLGNAPATTTDPVEAVADVDAVYTDVWVSMGEEEEREEKLTAFEGFQVNEELLSHAPDAQVMHCLPAHRGEEITNAVLESDRAVVWQQAENRLHGQKGLLVELVD